MKPIQADASTVGTHGDSVGSARRDGDKITVRLFGEQDEQQAREVATKVLEPWEVVRRSQGRGWQFRVDQVLSTQRKRILEMVMEGLDETERRIKKPTVRDYLTEIDDTVEHFLDDA